MKSAKLYLLAACAVIGLFPAAKGDVIIEAYVDGPSALHVTPTGIQWENGENAKPGKHEFHNFPTYVNGKAWMPEWTKPDEPRGCDKSDVYPIPFGTMNLELELLAVGEKRGATGIEERSPISMRMQEGDLLVVVPDPEWGPRWYRFVLRPSTVAPESAPKP